LDHNQSAVKNEAESKIRLKEIHDEITKLPDIFKHPFTLFFEGYKYNEIADYLQEPLGTVKSRIHFARKLLKESINRY
jgi:RNA polymerase sigma-70 factor (ECF subfamily)